MGAYATGQTHHTERLDRKIHFRRNVRSRCADGNPKSAFCVTKLLLFYGPHQFFIHKKAFTRN